MKRNAVLFAAGALLSLAGYATSVVTGVFGAPIRIDAVGRKATAVAVENSLLFCGEGGKLAIFDISDPLAPKLLKQLEGFDYARQIAVDRGWVAISSRSRGAWLVDARDPVHARVTARFETVEQATGIEIAGNAMFVGQRNCGVEFVDITDREHPRHARMVKTEESQTCVYENGILYSGDWHSGETTLIDARDFASARVIGRTAMKGLGDGLDLQGDFIYASTGHHRLRGPNPNPRADENWGKGHGFEIWKRTDPTHPTFVSRVEFPPFWRVGNDLWTARVSGDWAFCADTYNGLFAVNIAKPEKPTIEGRFVDPNPKDVEAPSRCVSYVAVAEGAVYAAVLDGGLYVIPCPKAKARRRNRGVLPANVAWRDPYAAKSARFRSWRPPTTGPVHSVAVRGECVYVGCGSAGCFIVDRSLKTVGQIPCDYARDVVISGDRLLVAQGAAGLGVYSLADPKQPTEIGRVTHFGRGNSTCEWVFSPCPRWAICSPRGNSATGWSFVDLADLQNPKVASTVGGLSWLRPFASRLIDGKWLGYAQTHSFLKWFDLSGDVPQMIDTENKAETGPLGKRTNFIRWRSGCSAFKDNTLLMAKDGKVIRLSAAQNRNADGSPWAGVDPVGCPAGVEADGLPEWDGDHRVVFVCTALRRVTMFDFSDPQQPRFVWSESTQGYPENAVFDRKELFVPCGYQGLLVADAPVLAE